jgi:NNP family nitrate/nitrite transporter-like MFS transporter
MLVLCFFPAGFAALAGIGPPQARNVAIALTIAIAFLVGGGAIPAGIGLMGEQGSFALGFVLVGVLLVGGVVILRYLRLHEETQ